MKDQAFNISDARAGSKIWHAVDIRSRPDNVCAPLSLEVQPTAACNLRCSWCSYWDRNGFSGEKAQWMTPESLSMLAEYCVRSEVRSVYISGGGEPTTHPRLPHFIRSLKDGPSVALITNGTRASPDLLDAFGHVTYIQVSIIGHSREHYLSNAGRDRFERMVKLPALVSDRHRSRRPLVGGMYVLAEHNSVHIADVVNLTWNAGYDYCSFRLPVDYEGRGVWASRAIAENIKVAIESLSPELLRFTNLAQMQYLPPTAHFAKQECGSLSLGLSPTVAPDGFVYLCVPDIGNKTLSIGNVNSEPFEDIWTGRRRTLIEQTLHNRYGLGNCDPGCRGHRYNAALAGNRPLRLDDAHPNFF